MELNQLLQFKTIAESGNMSKAAQSLYTSQPALSQNLAKLENELGTQLFDRQKKKIQLNATGKAVLEHVNAIFDEINTIRLITARNAKLSNHLRLTSYEDPSIRYFGSIICGMFPELTLDTSLKPDTEIIDNLKNDKVDIAFSASPIIHNDIFTTYLCKTQMSVSVPPDHELFDKEFLTWQDLDNQSFLIPAGYSYLFDKIAYLEKEQNITIKRLVQRDFGLYRSMATKSNYLTFASTLDHMYEKNPIRKDIPVVNPSVTINYYASCNNLYTANLLPYITCIQKFYWQYEFSHE